jgi:tetrathionate reductase subunit B
MRNDDPQQPTFHPKTLNPSHPSNEALSPQNATQSPVATQVSETRPESTNDQPGSRRDFLKATPAAFVILNNGRSDAHPSDDIQKKFQPEEHWKDRIQAPEDGKKYGWYIDTRRCFGCHACEVSCKAENDVPLGNYIRQTIYQDVGEYPQVARMFLPMACQHCEDAPCIKACPCGALNKGAGGSVLVDYDTCCGHGTCVDVCPYGAIYLDPVANQAVKCHNCVHRLEHSMEPACANTCPADAIYFGDLNDPDSKVSVAMKEAEESGVELSRLREEKKTEPRMWFSGPAPEHVEHRVPREGESYAPGGYDIYNWKESAGE